MIVLVTIKSFLFSNLTILFSQTLFFFFFSSGIPAIIGSIVVSIAVINSSGKHQVFPEGNYQAGAQLGGAFCTLVFSLLSGACVGKLIKTLLPNNSKPFRDG